MENAFITGSNAYGIPRSNSDIDVVVKLTNNDATQVANVLGLEAVTGYDDLSIRAKVGKLDLILVHNDKYFQLWKEGTEALKKKAPVTRSDACTFFRELFQQNGLVPHV